MDKNGAIAVFNSVNLSELTAKQTELIQMLREANTPENNENVLISQLMMMIACLAEVVAMQSVLLKKLGAK